MAGKAHITLTYISKLEAGGASPGLDTMERLAHALGVGLTELLPSPMPQPEDQSTAKQRFDIVLQKAGDRSLAMLNIFLERLAESPSLGR